jgi:hypothetical protein
MLPEILAFVATIGSFVDELKTACELHKAERDRERKARDYTKRMVQFEDVASASFQEIRRKFAHVLRTLSGEIDNAQDMMDKGEKEIMQQITDFSKRKDYSEEVRVTMATKFCEWQRTTWKLREKHQEAVKYYVDINSAVGDMLKFNILYFNVVDALDDWEYCLNLIKSAIGDGLDGDLIDIYSSNLTHFASIAVAKIEIVRPGHSECAVNRMPAVYLARYYGLINETVSLNGHSFFGPLLFADTRSIPEILKIAATHKKTSD